MPARRSDVSRTSVPGAPSRGADVTQVRENSGQDGKDSHDDPQSSQQGKGDSVNHALSGIYGKQDEGKTGDRKQAVDILKAVEEENPNSVGAASVGPAELLHKVAGEWRSDGAHNVVGSMIDDFRKEATDENVSNAALKEHTLWKMGATEGVTEESSAFGRAVTPGTRSHIVRASRDLRMRQREYEAEQKQEPGKPPSPSVYPNPLE